VPHGLGLMMKSKISSTSHAKHRGKVHGLDQSCLLQKSSDVDDCSRSKLITECPMKRCPDSLQKGSCMGNSYTDYDQQGQGRGRKSASVISLEVEQASSTHSLEILVMKKPPLSGMWNENQNPELQSLPCESHCSTLTPKSLVQYAAPWAELNEYREHSQSVDEGETSSSCSLCFNDVVPYLQNGASKCLIHSKDCFGSRDWDELGVHGKRRSHHEEASSRDESMLSDLPRAIDGSVSSLNMTGGRGSLHSEPIIGIPLVHDSKAQPSLELCVHAEEPKSTPKDQNKLQRGRGLFRQLTKTMDKPRSSIIATLDSEKEMVDARERMSATLAELKKQHRDKPEHNVEPRGSNVEDAGMTPTDISKNLRNITLKEEQATKDYIMRLRKARQERQRSLSKRNNMINDNVI